MTLQAAPEIGEFHHAATVSPLALDPGAAHTGCSPRPVRFCLMPTIEEYLMYGYGPYTHEPLQLKEFFPPARTLQPIPSADASQAEWNRFDAACSLRSLPRVGKALNTSGRYREPVEIPAYGTSPTPIQYELRPGPGAVTGFRERWGLTIDDLAVMLRLSRRQVKRYEDGLSEPKHVVLLALTALEQQLIASRQTKQTK